MRDLRSGQGDLTRRQYQAEVVSPDNGSLPASKCFELNRYPWLKAVPPEGLVGELGNLRATPRKWRARDPHWFLTRRKNAGDNDVRGILENEGNLEVNQHGIKSAKRGVWRKISALSKYVEMKDYVVIAAFAVLIYGIVRLLRVGKRPANYPPGPPTIPILGNIHQVSPRRLPCNR